MTTDQNVINKNVLNIRKEDEPGVIQASNTESANAIFQALQDKKNRFTRYTTAIKGSKFLGSMLQSATELERNKLIDDECDKIINQISARTGVEFSAIADTILVEDFSFIDKKGKLNSSFSSNSEEDMKYLFASCLTRLSGIIKRQVASRPISSVVLSVTDILWTKYNAFKSDEANSGHDVFASYLPESIRKAL